MAAPEHPLFRCPECGATDAWKADYYEAVWQSISLFDVGGEPLFGDYTGVTGSYDDGSTSDEAFACRECGHTIPLGRFVLVPLPDENAKALELLLAGLRTDCEYAEEGDSTIDALIEYKNALEDVLGRVVAERGLPPSEAPAGPETSP